MVQGSEANGPLWTSNNDSRITRMGKLLRKIRLDELPQLINIIRGEMSFIGPRPLVHSDLNKKILYYNYRLLAKPGLTGWAQVMFPDGLTPETN
jgi:lipopolysaccharide/colanic/teichoic acid biosynthesis glycosyltransferase